MVLPDTSHEQCRSGHRHVKQVITPAGESADPKAKAGSCGGAAVSVETHFIPDGPGEPEACAVRISYCWMELGCEHLLRVHQACFLCNPNPNCI